MSRRVHRHSLFALGALFALMIPLLVACGGGDTAAPTQAPAAATTPTTAATSAATTAAPRVSPAAASPGAARPAGASPATGSPAATGSPRAGASPATGAARGGDDTPRGGPNSTLEPVGRKGGRIIEVSFSDASTMNPMISGDTASSARIGMMFNGLVSINPDTGLPFGNLAEVAPTLDNGGISKDGLTYTFRLRRNVKFHDGRPLTSKDVVFTYQTMMKRETASPRTTDLLDRIDSITGPDEYTVVIKLKKIVAPFLVSNAGYGIVPEHILGQVPPDQIRSHPFSTGDPAQTIGTGPFKFKEWVKDDHQTLVKNPDFFQGEPALDEYIFKVVRDQTVVVSQLKTGESDFATGIQESFYEEMTRQPNVNAFKYDTYVFTYLAFNLDPAKTPLFQEKEVRQALAYGLDREAMIKAIRFGIGQVGHGTMPVLSWAYAPDQLRTKYTYDQRKAEQLLDAAGWRKGPDGIRAKDGQRLSFSVWTNAGNRVREQYLTAMQQQWRAIGVDAAPKTEELSAFLQRLDRADYEVYLIGFSWGVDPDQSPFWSCDGGFNDFKYCNKRVDELLAQGVTELDQNKRKQIYVEFQNIVVDEVPVLILDYPQTVGALNKRVKNMIPNAINLRWNSHTWFVTDGR